VLPITKAVIFCIHNTIVPVESLTNQQQEQLKFEDLMSAYGVES
jgi:uncharacterized protein (DUF433 family)